MNKEGMGIELFKEKSEKKNGSLCMKTHKDNKWEWIKGHAWSKNMTSSSARVVMLESRINSHAQSVPTFYIKIGIFNATVNY